jgi:phage protein D
MALLLARVTASPVTSLQRPAAPNLPHMCAHADCSLLRTVPAAEEPKEEEPKDEEQKDEEAAKKPAGDAAAKPAGKPKALSAVERKALAAKQEKQTALKRAAANLNSQVRGHHCWWCSGVQGDEEEKAGLACLGLAGLLCGLCVRACWLCAVSLPAPGSLCTYPCPLVCPPPPCSCSS